MKRNKIVTTNRKIVNTKIRCIRANKAGYGVKKMLQEVSRSELEATEITAAVVATVVSLYFCSFTFIRPIISGGAQPLGGYNAVDETHYTQEELHPGMNPDPAARGAELGRENAEGYTSVGTGGHWTGDNSSNSSNKGESSMQI
jgi:hypothetical protein